MNCGTKLLLDNRYRATDLLGAGGMGRNFLAVDERTPSKKRCVIKQFSPQPEIQSAPASLQKAVELFNREAVQLDELGDDCAQIPRLLAHIEQDKRLYFVQEFINGHNLLEELEQQGTYSEEQIRQLLADLLPLLKFIHQRGVIHRDIKPENIMRRSRDYLLVLIDFGISKQLSGTVMSMGTTVGTMGYAPPEQMTYGEALPASDLYALGATCIHLMTGTFPDRLYNFREKRWLWRDVLASRGAAVSQQLGQILDKMLKPDLGERYQSVDEVLAVLTPAKVPPAAPAQPKSFATPAKGASPASGKTPNYASLRCERTLNHTGDVYSVAFSPDGQILACGQSNDTIQLWQISAGAELRTLKSDIGAVKSVAFSPDGQTLASSNGTYNTIKLWQLSTGQELRTLKGHSGFFTGGINSVAFSPDGQILASGGGDKSIKLWQLSTGIEICSFTGHTKWISSVAFSPDGQIIASSSADKTVKLWQVSGGRELHTLKGHSGLFAGVNCIAFSPNGQILASGSDDNTIKLWQLSTGKELRTLTHAGSVYSVAFSPDGQTLASGSYDNTIKLWQVSGGLELCTLKAHSQQVNSVAFSPDGQILVSGSADQTVKIWRCD
jgi:WD40 repeat protein